MNLHVLPLFPNQGLYLHKDEMIDIPSVRNERILSCNALPRNNCLSPWRQSPTARPKRLIQYPPVLDLWEIDYAIRLALHVVEGNRRE